MSRHCSYDLLAALLRYPDEGYRAAISACLSELTGHHERAARLIAAFARDIQPLSDADLEELFTRTFDLNPVCCLEVGWHLYGEDYNRGAFMVRVRQQLQAAGIAESTELPDHLIHILPLLGRMDESEARPFISEEVSPALEKMQAGIARQNNPYENVIAAIVLLLAAPQGLEVERSEND